MKNRWDWRRKCNFISETINDFLQYNYLFVYLDEEYKDFNNRMEELQAEFKKGNIINGLPKLMKILEKDCWYPRYEELWKNITTNHPETLAMSVSGVREMLCYRFDELKDWVKKRSKSEIWRDALRSSKEIIRINGSFYVKREK